MMISLPRVSLVFLLVIAALSCAPQAQAPKNDSAEATASNTMIQEDSVAYDSSVFEPPRLSNKDFERFSKLARKGNASAMYTLSTHHLSGNEVELGYYWLREAAKLGECHAILHLIENTFQGVPLAEIPHWRAEQERLGCDPLKDDLVKPEIRMNSEQKESKSEL